MFKRKAKLKSKVWTALLSITLAIIYCEPIVRFVGATAGVTHDQQFYEDMSRTLFPFAVIAFGIIVSQFLPIWDTPTKLAGAQATEEPS